ncbi:MAG: hypothetical protein Q9198_007357, partial [Flavoplaca austrocitrina]
RDEEEGCEPDDCCNNELPLVLLIPDHINPALSLEWKFCLVDMIASRVGVLAMLLSPPHISFPNRDIVTRNHETFIMVRDCQGWLRGWGRHGFLHRSALQWEQQRAWEQGSSGAGVWMVDDVQQRNRERAMTVVEVVVEDDKQMEDGELMRHSRAAHDGRRCAQMRV